MTNLTHCPDCQEVLSLGARKCRCGWKSTESGIPAHRKYNDNHHFGTRSEAMAQKVRDAINSCKSFKPLPYEKTKPQVDYDEAELLNHVKAIPMPEIDHDELLREATREYNEI